MSRIQMYEAMIRAAQITELTPASPYLAANVVLRLQKVAASLHRRYEAACSYEWANTERYERRTERLEAKAQELAAEIPGLTVLHQRDPRGWPLVLVINNQEIGRLG